MTCKHTPISITFLLLLLAIASCSTETTNHKSVKRSGRVELLRDTWGVPHIFSDTDAGAMYGLGYAAAEDRAFQMYYNLRIIQGRLAELVGDVKIGVTRRLPQGKNSALRNDIKMRTIGYYRAAQKVAAFFVLREETNDTETRGRRAHYCAFYHNNGLYFCHVCSLHNNRA